MRLSKEFRRDEGSRACTCQGRTAIRNLFRYESIYDRTATRARASYQFYFNLEITRRRTATSATIVQVIRLSKSIGIDW